MMDMFFASGYYYYIPVALQCFCAFHSYQKGTINKWIYLIVFLPLVGSIIYIYSEIIANRSYRGPKVDIGAIINPGGKIKKLEENLRFTDTFANKIKLADAYLSASYIDKAIVLYETSLVGSFADNEHGLSQLIIAYYKQERYQDVISTTLKINRSQKFARSKAHLLYAMALENTGQTEQAEKEFKLMKGRYSCFEHRYEYSQFLIRANRDEDAHRILTELLDEVPHLSSMERKNGQVCFNKAKQELKALEA